MDDKKETSFEDGLEKDEKVSLSHLRAGTYKHRRLDPKTGNMVEVRETL
jgi:hypothetical protein